MYTDFETIAAIEEDAQQIDARHLAVFWNGGSGIRLMLFYQYPGFPARLSWTQRCETRQEAIDLALRRAKAGVFGGVVTR